MNKFEFNRRNLIHFSLLLFSLSFSTAVGAYEIFVRQIVGQKFDCIHESLTHAAVMCVDKEVCESENKNCDDPDWGGLRDGVRWNDDPLRLLNYGKTYAHSGAYFTHGKSVSVRDPARIDLRWNTHYRSHYGDMQFLHAMASSVDELPAVTQRKIIIWSEFMYRVGIGDIDLSLPLKNVPIEGIPAMF